MTDRPTDATDRVALNESPSEKEGKCISAAKAEPEGERVPQ